MKRFVSGLLALTLVFGSSYVAFGADSNADSTLNSEENTVSIEVPSAKASITYAVTGGNLYFDTSTGIITDCDTTVTSAIIPEKIRGKAVVGIGNDAFKSCHSLTSVTIPNTVTTIVSSAFYNCTSLTSVTIPDTLTTIGSSAFYGCSKLTNVTLPEALTELGASAFESTGITEIVVPSGVTTLNYSVFRNCKSLKTAEIKGAKYLIAANNYSGSDGVFYGCTSLESVILNEGIEEIGRYAFTHCTSLKSIVIPNGVHTLGEKVFEDCPALAEITLPSTVRNIGTSCFTNTGITTVNCVEGSDVDNINLYPNGASFNYISSLIWYDVEGGAICIDPTNGALVSADLSITKCVIPSQIEGVTVKSIAPLAFKGCEELTSVTLPDTVTSIGANAFQECTLLSSINIPSGVTYIGKYAFSKCSGLTSCNLPDSLEEIGEYAFNECKLLAGEINISDKVRTIGDFTFYNCAKITGVTLGANVEEIGVSAFDGCSLMTKFNTDKNTVLTSIGNYSFKNCTKLSDMNLVSSITSIGLNAFENAALTQVNVPNCTLGQGAFFNCGSLKSVTIAEGVTTILPYTFYGCKVLENVELPESITTLGSGGASYGAFRNCTKLKSIYIPKNVSSIDSPTFWDSGLNLVFCHSGTYADDTTLYPTGTALVYVDNPVITYAVSGGKLYIDTVTNNIVYADKEITSCVVPASVDGVEIKGITTNAFANCTNLLSMSLPATMDNIEPAAFATATNLGSMSIAQGGKYTYKNGMIYDGNTIVACLPKLSPSQYTFTTTETVGTSAFAGCQALKTVTVPSFVSSIETDAFKSSGLTTVNCVKNSYGDNSSLYSNNVTLNYIGEILKYPVTGGYITLDTSINAVIGADSTITEATIPEVYGAVSITNINANAFDGCNMLSEVTIPKSITAIDPTAFTNSSVSTVKCYKHTVAANSELYPAGTNIVLLDSNPITDKVTGKFDSLTESDSVTFPDEYTVGEGLIKIYANNTIVKEKNTIAGLQFDYISNGNSSVPANFASFETDSKGYGQILVKGNNGSVAVYDYEGNTICSQIVTSDTLIPITFTFDKADDYIVKTNSNVQIASITVVSGGVIDKANEVVTDKNNAYIFKTVLESELPMYSEVGFDFENEAVVDDLSSDVYETVTFNNMVLTAKDLGNNDYIYGVQIEDTQGNDVTGHYTAVLR